MERRRECIHVAQDANQSLRLSLARSLPLSRVLLALLVRPIHPNTFNPSPPIASHYVTGLSIEQNAQALVQKFVLGILNAHGRTLMSAVMRQRDGNNLYPPGEAPLKCIVTDYSSLTGSNKWLLASIMLLVFRPVLQSCASMVRAKRLPNQIISSEDMEIAHSLYKFRVVQRETTSLCLVELVGYIVITSVCTHPPTSGGKLLP